MNLGLYSYNKMENKITESGKINNTSNTHDRSLSLVYVFK